MKINRRSNQIKLSALLLMFITFLFNVSSAGVNPLNANNKRLQATIPLAGNIQSYIPYSPCIVNTTTYTFNCSSDHSGYTYFNVSVNGAGISGTESITTGSPVAVYDTNPVSNGSTVVVLITGGYMPTSSVLEGPFPVIWGSISGSTITFTNVPLNNGYVECGLLLN